MATTIIEFLLQSAVIFLAVAIPGFLAAIALLRKSDRFNTLELFFIGILLGMFIPGMLGLIEGEVGILFSPMLNLFNIILITVVSGGYILLTNTRVLPEKKPNKNTLLWMGGILIILFLAWWIRMQALSPYYYDFDPYYYNHMTQFIIQGGIIPVHDDFMWYPDLSDHRAPPILAYIEAGWYHLFSITNGMKQFDFNTMTMVSSLYPPILGMLIAFAAYLWMSREYDQRIALIVAGILAFTPVVISKSVSGEFLLEAFTLFDIVFFYATYSLAIKYKDINIALLCAFSIVIGLIGANFATPIVFLMAGTVGLVALVNFVKGEADKDFNKMNLIIAVIVLLSYLVFFSYKFPTYGSADPALFIIPFIAVVFAYLLQYLLKIQKNREDRLLYLSALLAIGIVLLIITPLGNIVVSPIMSMFTTAISNTNAVFKTIAEQGAAPSDLYGTVGILGLNIPFSITPFILLIAFILIAVPACIQLYRSGEIKNKEVILAIFGVVPLAAIGMIKAKYTSATGLMVPIAFGIIIGETYKWAHKDKRIRNAILIVGLLVLILQFLPYTYTILDSVKNSNIDVTNNTVYTSTVCGTMSSEIQKMQSSNAQFLTGTLVNAKTTEYGLYCSRVPDYWLNSMFWIRDNVGLNGRTTSWWDYGHWIESFGQSKGVIGNTQADMTMIEDVADKYVSNTPAAMISDMRIHNSTYLLLDQDLIGKWGALVYLSCYYDNGTTLAENPGQSQCDQTHSPEMLYIPVNPTSNDICNVASANGTIAIRVYSSFSQTYGFESYCSVGGSMPLIYANGTQVGINNILPEGQVEIGNSQYMEFMAIYSQNSSDAKGLFYNSVFYRGFFEGDIPGFTQVYPSTYSNEPNIPVRIYEINS